MKVLEPVKDQNPESIRRVVTSYFSKVAMSKTSEKDAAASLAILDAFSEPYPAGSDISRVLLSLGEVLIGRN